MLHVAIEHQCVREVAGSHPLDRGAHRVPLASIMAVLEHVCAGSTRQARGPVGRPVIDDKNVIDLPAQPVDHLLNGRGLVEGGDDGDGADRALTARPSAAHSASIAGSTKSEAPASVTMLTADTRPIERSGG